MTVREINLKYDMPPAAVALQRMENELAGARRSGQKLFKFVHGYGSSGTGGKIRGAVRRSPLCCRERSSAPFLPLRDRRRPAGPACGRTGTGDGRMTASR